MDNICSLFIALGFKYVYGRNDPDHKIRVTKKGINQYSPSNIHGIYFTLESEGTIVQDLTINTIYDRLGLSFSDREKMRKWIFTLPLPIVSYVTDTIGINIHTVDNIVIISRYVNSELSMVIISTKEHMTIYGTSRLVLGYNGCPLSVTIQLEKDSEGFFTLGQLQSLVDWKNSK